MAQRERGVSAELVAGLDRMDRVVGGPAAPRARAAHGAAAARRRAAAAPGPRNRARARQAGRGGAARRASSSSTARSSIGSGIRSCTSCATPSITASRRPKRATLAGKPAAGRIVIDARRERDHVRIAVSDDGRGIDLESVRARAVEAGLLHADLADDLPPGEIASLVFRPGLSTAREVSKISGRGVGMDAVKATIEALGGSVELGLAAGPRDDHDAARADHGGRPARAAYWARRRDRRLARSPRWSAWSRSTPQRSRTPAASASRSSRTRRCS